MLEPFMMAFIEKKRLISSNVITNYFISQPMRKVLAMMGVV